MYQLRDNQQRCIQSILDGIGRGVNRQLLVAATGFGKTICIAEAARVIPGRTLVIDHRDELTVQNGRKLVAMNPEAYVGIEQGDKWCRGDEDIIVGSVQSLSRNKCKRLRRLLQYGVFQKFIVDEAHHVGAQTYIDVLQCLQEYNRNLVVLGFTATPKRSDGKGLEKTFEEVTFTYTIREAIEDGYLVDILPEKIVTKTNLDQVHIQRGDFKGSELAKAVNTDERNSLLVKGWLDHAFGEQTVVFCADVAHCRNVTDLFCRQGVSAEMIIGETDTIVRKEIYRRYSERKTKVLVSVDVLTEGWDAPVTQAVLMARPTKSQLIYIQQLGRGTRPDCDLTGLNTPDERKARIAASGKPYMHLLDVVDNTTNNSPIMLADLFGVPKNIKLRKTTIVAAARKIEKALADAPNLRIDKVKDIEKLQQMVTEALKVKIWDVEPPKEVKEHSRLSWMKVSGDYHIQLGKHETLIVRQNALGQYEAAMQTDADYDEASQSWKSRETHFEVLGHEPTLENMFARADTFIEANYADQMILLNQSAKWKKDTATDKQIGFLRRQQYNIREHNGDKQIWDGAAWIKLTKGRAAMLIGRRMDELNGHRYQKAANA